MLLGMMMHRKFINILENVIANHELACYKYCANHYKLFGWNCELRTVKYRLQFEQRQRMSNRNTRQT